jgi:hypothetical protein
MVEAMAEQAGEALCDGSPRGSEGEWGAFQETGSGSCFAGCFYALEIPHQVSKWPDMKSVFPITVLEQLCIGWQITFVQT